jgi:hypothetical protein
VHRDALDHREGRERVVALVGGLLIVVAQQEVNGDAVLGRGGQDLHHRGDELRGGAAGVEEVPEHDQGVRRGRHRVGHRSAERVEDVAPARVHTRRHGAAEGPRVAHVDIGAKADIDTVH